MRNYRARLKIDSKVKSFISLGTGTLTLSGLSDLGRFGQVDGLELAGGIHLHYPEQRGFDRNVAVQAVADGQLQVVQAGGQVHLVKRTDALDDSLRRAEIAGKTRSRITPEPLSRRRTGRRGVGLVDA